MFRAGDTGWGVADLMRAGRPFSAAEAAYTASLSSAVARGLSTAARAHVQDLTTAPGMLVIGADGLIESATAEASAQLPRLYAQGLPRQELGTRRPPEPVHAVPGPDHAGTRQRTESRPLRRAGMALAACLVLRR